VRAQSLNAGRLIESLLGPFGDEAADAAETYAVVRRPDGPGFSVYLDGERIINTTQLDEACHHVVWHSLKLATESTDRYLVLHGAAVESGGVGVILAAPPDSGKTTLAAALVGSGYGFVADEYALIDRETGFVHPYARPFLLPARSLAPLERLLALPAGSIPRGVARQSFVPPDSIRPRSLGEPCQVRFIVRPRYRAAGWTALQSRPRANVILELARESFNFDRLGPAALPLLAGVVEGTQTYDLPMSDLREAVLLVRRLVARGTA